MVVIMSGGIHNNINNINTFRHTVRRASRHDLTPYIGPYDTEQVIRLTKRSALIRR